MAATLATPNASSSMRPVYRPSSSMRARLAVEAHQVERLGVDDRLDDLLECLLDDRPDAVLVPALGQGQDRRAHPGDALLVGSQVEVDQLTPQAPEDRAPGYEALLVER